MNWAKKSRGFTVVEILIVVIVLSILVTIVIVAFSGVQRSSRDNSRTNSVTLLVNALKKYYDDKGEYPAACSSAGTGCDATNLATALVPNYISAIPNDPGQMPFQYVYRTGFATAGVTDSYAIRIQYENQPACKVGVNVAAGWWGVPMCPQSGITQG